MLGFGKKKQEAPITTVVPNDSPVPVTAASQINGDNTVKEWLDHPIGGVIFRDMLAQAGQKESVLKVVQRLPLKRLVKMSRGQFTEEMMNNMITKANSGEAPVTPQAASAEESKDESLESKTSNEDEISSPNLPDWQEKITEGRFNGKTVIVTGAGSGIGRATASRVAREGGRIIAVDISEDRLSEFKSELPDKDIVTVAGDITDDGCISRIIEAAGDTIDGLANVAGIMDNFTPLHEMSDDTWWRVINVNLVGMMKLSRAVIPKMLLKNRGNIVNVGSEASLKASAAGAAYTTSKHAVVGLTKSIAFMYSPLGLHANVVAPGAVLTNIEARYESKLGEERANSVIATAPAAAEANQLAAAITFLLSDDSTNVNGAVLPSDGGWSVQ